MSKKRKKIKNESIVDSDNVLLKPAGKVLAELILEKEAAFLASWMHFKTAENDLDALHNMRVDLRRLRVWVKLTRDEVKTNQKANKQLKALAKASNPLRDHEVMLSWLALAKNQIGGVSALDNLIEYGKQAYKQQSTQLIFSTKQSLAPQPKQKISVGLEQWLEKTLEQRIKLIDQLLHTGMGDAHLARIEIKYLRYLLEPFSSSVKNSKELVSWCKEVQEILGDFHDLQVFRSHLPDFARWVIDHELVEVTLSSGKQSRAITKVFANARESIIALSGWQDQELSRQWFKWLDRRDNYLLLLQTLRKNQNSTHLV